MRSTGRLGHAHQGMILIWWFFWASQGLDWGKKVIFSAQNLAVHHIEIIRVFNRSGVSFLAFVLIRSC